MRLPDCLGGGSTRRQAYAAGTSQCRSRNLAPLLLLGLLATVADGFHTGAGLLQLENAPLHTNGRYIVSKAGERVKWSCLNWYGAYSEKHVVGGLEVRSLEDIVDRVKELGFNCIRLCYSTEGHVTNPLIAAEDVAGNPRFTKDGTRFLDVFDATIKAITDAGLMVIINNHNHKSGWCCHYSQDEGLWYTDDYSEQDWIWSLTNMTARYKSNKLVVGIDLRNEVHDYQNTILTWGDGDPLTDWAAAATRAGNEVLKVNPDVIIVVMCLCFGMELRPAKYAPIELDVPHRVVYQAHNYLEYQVWGAISQAFLSWRTIRYITATILLITIPTTLIQVLAWRRLGMPTPPRSVALATAGLWWFVVCLISMITCTVFYLIMKNYCGYWNRRDIIPAISMSAVLSLVGLGAIAGGFYVRDHSAAVSDDEMTTEDEDVDSPDQSLVPVPVRRRFSRRTSQGSGSAAGAAAAAGAGTMKGGCGFCEPTWDSWSLSIERIWGDQRAEKDPPEAAWDKGLCYGLQCFCLCIILLVGIGLVFWFSNIATGYRLLEWHFNNMWGFVLEEGHPYTAPVWMGEFGNSRRGEYWIHFMRYLTQHNVDFAYWALNGKKWKEGSIDPRSGQWIPLETRYWDNETYGVFKEDYKTIRSAWRLLDLQELLDPPVWWPSQQPCNRAVLGSECGG